MQRNNNAHHPDCDIPSDALKSLIFGKFPTSSDGVTRIPYTFFGQRHVHPGSLSEVGVSLRLSSLPVPKGYQALLRSIITNAFDVWSKIADNKIVFYEADNRFEAKGLRFNLSPTDELNNLGAGALTLVNMDNSGNIGFSDIYYPAEEWFWEQVQLGDTWAFGIIFHEMEHALGVSTDWPEDSVAMQTLRETKDGVFCSIMPYYDRVKTDVSSCNHDCNPYMAKYPGPTDVKLLNMAYNSGEFPKCVPISSYAAPNEWLSFAHNAADIILTSALTSASYEVVVGYGKNLKFNKDTQASVPENVVHLVADAGMLGAMIYMEMPWYQCTAFGVTAATKYLPDFAMKKLPEKLQTFLKSGYPLYAANLVNTVRRGFCIIPLVASSGLSMAATWAGRCLGGGIGKKMGEGTSYVVRKIRYSCATSNSSEDSQHLLADDDVADIERPDLDPDTERNSVCVERDNSALVPEEKKQTSFWSRLFCCCSNPKGKPKSEESLTKLTVVTAGPT